MGRMLTIVAGVFLGMGLSASASAQTEMFDPTGIWEPRNKESRYEFSYCGEDRRSLCAELIWIQEDKKDSRNVKYLNTYMFTDARQTRANFWQGRVSLEGFTISGSVEQRNANRMDLRACALFVLCEEIRLNRVSN